MSLVDLADLYIQEGWGRKISQQEAFELTRQSEEEGLVLMPGNEQQAASASPPVPRTQYS